MFDAGDAASDEDYDDGDDDQDDDRDGDGDGDDGDCGGYDDGHDDDDDGGGGGDAPDDGGDSHDGDGVFFISIIIRCNMRVNIVIKVMLGAVATATTVMVERRE